MFLENKYTKWYFNIIENAKSRTIYEGYTEKHHIIPKSFGGCNDSVNMITLTAREHFICHKLLVKMTVGVERSKMAVAVLRLCKQSKFHNGAVRIAGIKYEHARLALSKAKTGQPVHPNTMKALNESRNKNGGPNKGKKIHENTKAAIRESHVGIPLSDEHKKKVSNALRGRKYSPETLQKMKDSAKRRCERAKANRV